MKAFEIKKERRTYTHLYAMKGVARHRWCMWILFEKATLRGRANTPVFSAKWWACLSYHVCDTWLKMNQTIQINTWTTSKLHLKIRHNSTSRSRGNQQINICIRLCECIFISFLAAYKLLKKFRHHLELLFVAGRCLGSYFSSICITWT